MRARDGVRAACAALAVLLLAAGILREGLTARADAMRQAGTALALHAAGAQSLMAEQSFLAGDMPAAASHSRAALARAPTDIRALRIYGLAMDRTGAADQATAAMHLAGALGWRDPSTQLWLIKDAIQRGDLPTAAQRIDAVLRIRGFDGEMDLAVRALASVPAGADAIAERLRQGPDWRPRFFQDVTTLPAASYPAMEALFERLRTGPAPLRPDEVERYVESLAAHGAYARARSAWLRWGAPGDPDAALQDGDFATVADADGIGRMFGWTLAAGVGGSIRTDESFAIGTRVLRIDQDGTVSRPLLAQAVLLAPGEHLFEVATAASSHAAEGAARWSLRCAGREDDVPWEPGPARGAMRWTVRTIAFAVPPDCPAQVLTLSAVALARPGSATMWFTHAKLR